ncbi:hypothetical protein IAD21_00228 [Abditibacteriota bacterium]|nr:hypothetical protein IAD21_00228 [Abditibacteriota bacterium]
MGHPFWSPDSKYLAYFEPLKQEEPPFEFADELQLSASTRMVWVQDWRAPNHLQFIQAQSPVDQLTWQGTHCSTERCHFRIMHIIAPLTKFLVPTFMRSTCNPKKRV